MTQYQNSTPSTPDGLADPGALRRALQSPITSVAHQARERAAAAGPAAISLLAGLSHDPSPSVRWEAVHALADMHRPETADWLVESLTDSDGGVRWLAAEGLVELGADGLRPLLHALLQHSESVWLRDGVHHVLTGMLHLGRLPAPAMRVLTALEGREPAIGVLEPTDATLVWLEAGLRRAS